MLRRRHDEGWILITHRDHAELAGAFAESWGNELFLPPEPRREVLRAVARHDDGWTTRDARPQITAQGKPGAFSVELVGKYSAFEEIDLADYLDVRRQALEEMEAVDPYAAVVISMHTYNLLSERADRSTIASGDLPLLDRFLDRQRERQEELKGRLRAERKLAPEQLSEEAFQRSFRFLQACDSLSLLACVAYTKPCRLQHALPTADGANRPVEVIPRSDGSFQLVPFPFPGTERLFRVPSRTVNRSVFGTADELCELYVAATPVDQEVRLIA